MKKTHILLVSILLIASFLRLWKLDQVPSSLFGDELDVGYHAYSILHTGRDYHGNFMPLQFHSLAEYRTPLYLYSSVPTVALFGINAWGVRLPAALFGILGIWGIYLLVKEMINAKWQMLNKEKSGAVNSDYLALVASFLLAISPWHIQYSRGGFEVTEMLVFLLFGLYFFFRAIQGEGKFLWLSVLLLVTMPWIYSTAKLFTPFLLLFVGLVWFINILRIQRKYIVYAIAAGLVVGIPLLYANFFSGGTQRFNYISVFNDPTIEPVVGTARFRDALSRGELVDGLKPSLADRTFHNKVVFWVDRITTNYLNAFSTDFLFNEGDPNLRHSIKGVGQFFKIEFFPLILGLIFFFTAKIDKKIKWFVAFWFLAGVLPSSITRDGGNHATRLILVLPPVIFLISFGLVNIYKLLPRTYNLLLITCYILLLSLNFVFYQHNFWVHNARDAERWWHSGWQESIQTIKSIDQNYDKVIITMSDEPAWIFFAGWYEYDPSKWQKEFPVENKTTLHGFGEVSHIDKYYFGSFHPPVGGIYDLPKYIDNKTLYLASAKEIGANLIAEPERTPGGLQLIESIAYPSGEPVFYLFTHE